MRRRTSELEDLDAIERRKTAYLKKLIQALAILDLYLRGISLDEAWFTVLPDSNCTIKSAGQQASTRLRWLYQKKPPGLMRFRLPTDAPTIRAAVKELRVEALVHKTLLEKMPLDEAFRAIYPRTESSDASARQQASRLLRSWPAICAAQARRSPWSFLHGGLSPSSEPAARS